MKKTLKRLSVFVLAIAVCVTMFAKPNKADTQEIKIEMNGFHFTFYDDGGGVGSLWLTGYSGDETELVLPTHIIYNSNRIPVEEIASEAFKGNTKITKVIIPDGYKYIGSNAFAECTGIKEMVISGTVDMMSEEALANIINCKTYRLGAAEDPELQVYMMSNIAASSNYEPYMGVTAYVVQGSNVDRELQLINGDRPNAPITIKYGDDPAKEAHVTRVLPEDPEPTKPVETTKPAETTKPNDNNNVNPYEKGADYSKADSAITNYSSESDPAGSVYGLLQLKQKKVKKNAIKVAWKKVPGAVKYAYYATNCGPKNKYVKHGISTGTSFNYKKICGKKLKKGKYYKFIVIAIDKNNKVVSTSKTVHIATKGGKVTNNKGVKTKAKKNKVNIKTNKTFKLKAKLKKPKKGKVKIHRPIKYESLNPTVASVNAKGVIKGVKKGKTSVFAYAQNGTCAKVKVTVK